MLKRVSESIPAPVQVNKGEWGYLVWIFEREEQRKGINYFRYKLAHPFNRRFVMEKDANLFGYSRIHGKKCPLYQFPMRHKSAVK